MKWALIGKILTAFLVVGVIGGGAYYLGTKSTSPTRPSPTPANDTTTVEQTVSLTPQPTETEQKTGSISGTLGYPSEAIPPLTVYALSKGGSGKNFFVKTAQDQSTFTIEDVEPGIYHVVAYTDEFKLLGGWTKMVSCGLSVNCTDHSLIPVTVVAGETATGVEVKDWYAPEGTFPPRPQ